MTSTAIPSTNCVDMAFIARLFVQYKGRYGGLWTCRGSSDEEWSWIMEDWLAELGRFSAEQVRAATEKSIALFIKAPPTLPQLVDLCLEESGVPAVQDIIRQMIKREFNHPMVKMIYEKIGSWDLANGKSEEIERRVKEHYSACKANFHAYPEKSWDELNNYNSKSKALPPPTENESAKTGKGLKERMEEFYKKREELKQTMEIKEFDKNSINKTHKDFDQDTFNQYKNYLLSISDSDVIALPTGYMYDRIRFIGQAEQLDDLRESEYFRYESNQDNNNFESPNIGLNYRNGANANWDQFNMRSGYPRNVYKDWMGDT